jgi:hypothetical protein
MFSSIECVYFEISGLLESDMASQVPDVSKKRSGLIFKG